MSPDITYPMTEPLPNYYLMILKAMSLIKLLKKMQKINKAWKNNLIN